MSEPLYAVRSAFSLVRAVPPGNVSGGA